MKQDWKPLKIKMRDDGRERTIKDIYFNPALHEKVTEAPAKKKQATEEKTTEKKPKATKKTPKKGTTAEKKSTKVKKANTK